MILLFHETATDSKISTPARLGREQHSPRHYQSEGHFLALDGPGHIIAHDAEDICKIDGWRLATPQEQDAYHASKRQSSAIHENVPAPAEGESSTDVPSEEDLTEDTSTDETSAPESAETEQASNTTAPTRGTRRKK